MTAYKGPFVRRAAVAMLLAGTALGGFAAGHGVWAQGAPQGAPATVQLAPTDSGAIRPTGTPHLIPDFADLVSQVKPAVVSITTRLPAQDVADDDDAAPRMGRGFPGQGFPGMGRGARPRGMEARGSGFIVDANGTIVTNNHVVKGATSVSVTLDDGTVLPAKVVGTDPRTDLAVLRVSADRKLPFISLGESDDVRPGQWVVAMGNPFGLGGSVTAGIVSARGRDIGSGPYDSFIQVDAPINQGNSGGPLFSQDGKVVGVNTAIISPSGGSVGIGFAIPADTVRGVVAQLEKTGHVTRGFLGVQAQPVSPAMARAMHLPSPDGALVANIEADSPAAKAGLQPGDVIRSVDGQKIASPRELAVDVAAIRPGTEAVFQVLRDGQGREVKVSLATLPGDGVEAAAAGENGGGGGIGLALAELTPDARGQLNLPRRVRGAVIAEVKAGSAAEQAGLQPGDVVVGVGAKAVTNPDEAVAAIRSATADGGTAALRVFRDGATHFVAVGTKGDNGQG